MKNRPKFWGANVARQAQRRYLTDRKTQWDRIEEAKKATAEVFAICILAALYDLYGIGESRLDKVADATNGLALRYEAVRSGPPKMVGGKKLSAYQAAESMIAAETGAYFPADFVLPAHKMPKKSELMKLAIQRESAATVARLYAFGIHEALGFGADRIACVMREAVENYRQFRDAADTGDYYGYSMLAKKMGQILHTDCEVDEVGGEKPIFGDTVY